MILFEVEYSNFLKCWESATTSGNYTASEIEKMENHSIKIHTDDGNK